MKNRSIELQLIKPVSGRSNMKGRITLKDLQKELLTDLNVPFADFCCETYPGTFPLGQPVRYYTGELQYLDENGVWQPAGGGGLRFAVPGEDDSADSDRTFDMAGFNFAMNGGLTALLQFDTINLASGSEGSMIVANWNAQAPIIQMGDADNWGFGTLLTIDDGARSILFNSVGDGTLFNVFGGGTFYAQLGNDGIGSGTNMYINDSTRIFEVASTTSMLRLNNDTNEYMFGNYDVKSGIFISDSGTGNYTDIYSVQTGAGEVDIFLNAQDGSIAMEASNPTLATNAWIYINLPSSPNTISLNATSGIQTSDPNGADTRGKWKLGKLIAAAVTPDTTRYLEVNVEGVVYKVIVST